MTTGQPPKYPSKADEDIWGWPREEATGNLYLGNKAKVEKKVISLLPGPSCPKRGEETLPERPAIKG